MDISETRLDGIESQSLTDRSHAQNSQNYFSMKKIGNIFLSLCSRVFFRGRGEATLHESVTEFPTDLYLSELFDFPDDYVVMNAEMLSTLSDRNEDWLEQLRSHGTPLASLKNVQGDSVLHLAVTCNHLEVVKNIISESPSLLLEPNSKDQLPIHVVASYGHHTVVEALVASFTFFSARLDEEDRGILNPYIYKDIYGDTPLKLALKGGYTMVALCLVNENREASFLASKDEISPLYLAVESGNVSLVKKMLENGGINFNLEGKKYLVHAALKSMNTDMLDVIFDRCSTLLDERDEKGRTCLSFGASMGYYKGVCKLLDRSTEGIFVRGDDGYYPIHNAVEKGHINIVKEILKRCPYSKHLLNNKGQNVLHIAAEIGRFKILSYLMKRECMCQHLAVEQDEDGNTPLHLATMNWRPRAVRCLAGSTNMLIRNNDNLTALDIAESKRKPKYIFLEIATLLALINAHGHNDPRCKHIVKGIKPITHNDGGNKAYINALLVVAALIATVTFQAAFTLPGGTKNESPNLGMANLATDISGKRKYSYFFIFLIFDVFALLCSLLSVTYLIVAQLGDPTLYDSSISLAMKSLFSSIYSMILAFIFAMLIAAGNATGLSFFVYNVILTVFCVVTLMYYVLLMLQGNRIGSRLVWWLFCLLIPIDDDGSYQLQVDE